MTGLDPKIEPYLEKIIGAWGGGGQLIPPLAPGHEPNPSSDAAIMAAAMLHAYPRAAALQPAQALQPAKAFTAELADPDLLQDPAAAKNWLDDVVGIVQSVGPVLVQVLSKDYTPPPLDIKAVIDSVPEARRNDPDFARYTSTLAVTVAQGSLQGMSNSGAPVPDLPPAPEGKDKAWYNDVLSTVSKLAPAVLPLIPMLL